LSFYGYISLKFDVDYVLEKPLEIDIVGVDNPIPFHILGR
jgi:hypothetical protein